MNATDIKHMTNELGNARASLLNAADALERCSATLCRQLDNAAFEPEAVDMLGLEPIAVDVGGETLKLNGDVSLFLRQEADKTGLTIGAVIDDAILGYFTDEDARIGSGVTPNVIDISTHGKSDEEVTGAIEEAMAGGEETTLRFDADPMAELVAETEKLGLYDGHGIVAPVNTFTIESLEVDAGDYTAPMADDFSHVGESAVIGTLASNPASTIGQLASLVGSPVDIVRPALLGLLKSGKVVSTGERRAKRYSVAKAEAAE